MELPAIFRKVLKNFLVLVLISVAIALVIGGARVLFHSAHRWFNGPEKPLNTATGTMQDTEGKRYPTTTLGNLEWMAANLNTAVFRDGTPIPQARTYDEWRNAWEQDQPVWAWIGMDEQKGKQYGRLYNWYAVTDPRGLAPAGWELPDSLAWLSLINSARVDAIVCRGGEPSDDEYISGNFDALVLQSPDEEWINTDSLDPDWSRNTGTNEALFNALPGGMIDVATGKGTDQATLYSRAAGIWAGWWGKDGVYMIIGDHAHGSGHDQVVLFSNPYAVYGLNVRCVRKISHP